MRDSSPLGALVRGLVAGAIGAGAMTGFFMATARVAPRPKEGAFEPPEEEQSEEQPPETIARRAIEHVAMRPVGADTKKYAGQLVHFGFGASWGALYALSRESYPALASPAGALGFSTLVWVIGDAVVVPFFRVGPTPRNVSPAEHGYVLGAHVLYGACTAGCYELLRAPTSTATAIVGLMGLDQLFRRSALQRLAARLPMRRRATIPSAARKVTNRIRAFIE